MFLHYTLSREWIEGLVIVVLVTESVGAINPPARKFLGRVALLCSHYYRQLAIISVLYLHLYIYIGKHIF